LIPIVTRGIVEESVTRNQYAAKRFPGNSVPVNQIAQRGIVEESTRRNQSAAKCFPGKSVPVYQ
jgi:hypothetical protein